jgi:hypothetical protein
MAGRGWRGGRLLAGGGVLLFAAITLVAVKLSGSGVSSPQVAANLVAVIDPRGDRS